MRPPHPHHLPLPFSTLTSRTSPPHSLRLHPPHPHPHPHPRRPSTSTSTSHPSPPPHPIVSSFLSTGTEGTPTFRIALFKRSAHVSVYKNRYAPISGSISPTDPSPLAAAARELREETRLAPPAISLLRAGAVYDLLDATLTKRWRIYTFLWRLHAPSAHTPTGEVDAPRTPSGESGSDGPNATATVAGNASARGGEEEEEERVRAMMTLCSENTAVVFVRPEDVGRMDTVPDLERGVRAVVRGHFLDKREEAGTIK